MSKVAKLMTGLSDSEFLDRTLLPTGSRMDVFYPKGAVPRQSARVFGGKLVGPEDLNDKRRQLRENIPPALRIEK